uniref:Uncharacterized protein LHFPL7 isoform X2 n=1 Tax=Pogona vitticeps TaxID=103695 RepID=A0ABM5ENJ1_9SAUR
MGGRGAPASSHPGASLGMWVLGGVGEGGRRRRRRGMPVSLPSPPLSPPLPPSLASSSSSSTSSSSRGSPRDGERPGSGRRPPRKERKGRKEPWRRRQSRRRTCCGRDGRRGAEQSGTPPPSPEAGRTVPSPAASLFPPPPPRHVGRPAIHPAGGLPPSLLPCLPARLAPDPSRSVRPGSGPPGRARRAAGAQGPAGALPLRLRLPFPFLLLVLVLPSGPRMFSGVGCFWVLLSSCLVAVCSFSFLSPAWIVKEPRAGGGGGGAGGARRVAVTAGAGAGAAALGVPPGVQEVSFGLLWHCAETLQQRLPDCYAFGGLGRFSQMPSGSWQTSAVLCAGGCALLALSSLLAVVVLFLPSGQCERRACFLAGYIQMAAETFPYLINVQNFISKYLEMGGCQPGCSPLYSVSRNSYSCWI